MKKFLAMAMAMAGILLLTACNNSNPADGWNLDGEIGGEITISTFDSMANRPFLEEAARLFMAAHPGTIIHVESFQPPPIQTEDGRLVAGQADSRDYINMINTELMSGRGPDILTLDVLPFHEYARNGQLVDLRPFMEADSNFNINDYRVSLFDAVTTEQGIFLFPTVYFFWFLTYDASMFTESQLTALQSESVFSVDRLVEISRPILEQSNNVQLLHRHRDSIRIFNELFDQNYSHFIDIENRQANFTDGVFADMLNRTMEWEQSGFFHSYRDSLFATVPSTSLMSAYIQGDSFLRGLFGMSNNSNLAGVLGNDAGDANFYISTGFGINANSQNQRTAWEFIRFLSNEAMRQVATVNLGLPTHIGAFQERAERSGQGAAVTEYIALVEYLTSQLNTSTEANILVRRMVSAEVPEFFNGSRTADEVARTLQSRISLFLSE